jgi:predicted HicB family RNase H-like nuclease
MLRLNSGDLTLVSIVEGSVADMRTNGKTPPTPLSSKPFSGKFVVRVPPEVHRELAVKAAEEGISLNRLINSKLS